MDPDINAKIEVGKKLGYVIRQRFSNVLTDTIQWQRDQGNHTVADQLERQQKGMWKLPRPTRLANKTLRDERIIPDAYC